MTITIILAFTMTLAIIRGAPLYRVELSSKSLGQNEYFEGDLNITDALIQQYYNVGSFENQTLTNNSRVARSAANNVRLWENGTVPYRIFEGFSFAEQETIRHAMDRWEDTTCLRFVPRTSQLDYIYFINWNLGCFSTSIGKQGLVQFINLKEYGCTDFAVILHEIGHAIGFWHEQSRPDRDNYVRINWDNMDWWQRHNFMKRKDFDIDYQGSVYDYGSIMQYSERAFVKRNCRGCKTIEVSNEAEYKAQGRPWIGQRSDLSSSDIQQANRLYSCAGTGVYGRLTVRVKYGRGLKDLDGFWDLSDPYVIITAVDGSGTKHVRQTSTESDTLKPRWYENLEFPEREWQFFRIRVWDEDWIWDDQMSMSETVVISTGSHSNQKHCHDTLCNGYVYYDYFIST